MKSKFFGVVTFCLLSLVFASSAFAQDQAAAESSSPAKTSSTPKSSSHSTDGPTIGPNSLALTLFGGNNPYAGGTIGYWRLLLPSLNVGVNLGFSVDTNPKTQFYFLLGPTMKYYLTDSDVRPFVFGQFQFSIAKIEDQKADVGLGMTPAFGVEWMITNNFSVSGMAGITFHFLRENQEGFAMGTFTSSLAGHFYF